MFAQIIIKLIKHERNVRIHQSNEITARPTRKLTHAQRVITGKVYYQDNQYEHESQERAQW